MSKQWSILRFILKLKRPFRLIFHFCTGNSQNGFHQCFIHFFRVYLSYGQGERGQLVIESDRNCLTDLNFLKKWFWSIRFVAKLLQDEGKLFLIFVWLFKYFIYNSTLLIILRTNFVRRTWAESIDTMAISTSVLIAKRA